MKFTILALQAFIFFEQIYLLHELYASDSMASAACKDIARSIKAGMSRAEVEAVADYDGGLNGGDAMYFPGFIDKNGKSCKIFITFRHNESAGNRWAISPDDVVQKFQIYEGFPAND